MKTKLSASYIIASLASIALLTSLESCTPSSGGAAEWQQPPQALPVLTVSSSSATTFKEFSASLEGSKDIEIRAQVDGYVDKIHVDEGAFVKKGQILFKINDQPYAERLNNAKANLAAAKANLANAEINVYKLTPLVENNVVSDIQLRAAKAAYEAALASVTQAEAMVRSAAIDLGYTTITASSDGYIGRILVEPGSLVGASDATPLTVLSEIKEVYAYFSFSEREFLEFIKRFEGNTIQEKISQMPLVELILADNTVYPYKGKVETVAGQFNSTTGAISFRASFPNASGLLRSGNTGRVRIPYSVDSAVVVPQESTFELQDKIFVFAVSDSNKVYSTPIRVADNVKNFYLVEAGLKPGDKIVYAGLDRLNDGAMIQPEPISLDSLLNQ
ncbi:MAG: efflux RND transporter periplasmic adaptor subunit [Cyclobacteriaceae bacterium]|nr:efflux RND transporter periplasmic adaptor subunit [Cyclobacteriaceae bacterium]